MRGRHSAVRRGSRLPTPVGENCAAERRPASRGRGRGGRGLIDGWLLVSGVLVVVVALAMVIHAFARPRVSSADGASGGTASAQAKTVQASEGSAGAKAQAKDQPTGVFAKMAHYGVELHFPAVPAEMVAVGFHQAWNVKATDMLPAGKPHPKDKYEATKQALRFDPSLKAFLMASRGRGSSEYTAADCAVKPGSLILSPVTGVVTLVKTYQLSGYGTDYQIEIKADGASPVRVVMIHLKDVTIKSGDRVEGGVTPIATVRHLTGIDNQVNRYLPVPADHTHVQINDVGYKLNEAS